MPEKNKKNKKSGGNGEDKDLNENIGPTGKEKSQAGSAEDAEAKLKEEEMVRKLQEEIDKLTTADIVAQMLASLSSLAYKKMGIPAGVNDKFKDKQQAKMAVDAYDALLKVLEGEVSASEFENLRSSLSNLQLNFVKSFD